jgi:hypothetical protein
MRARLGQAEHPVAEHLRPHGKPAPAVQPGKHGVGDGADARLQGRAVADERGDPVTDEGGRFRHGPLRR